MIGEDRLRFSVCTLCLHASGGLPIVGTGPNVCSQSGRNLQAWAMSRVLGKCSVWRTKPWLCHPVAHAWVHFPQDCTCHGLEHQVTVWICPGPVFLVGYASRTFRIAAAIADPRHAANHSKLWTCTAAQYREKTADRRISQCLTWRNLLVCTLACMAC